MAVLGVPSDVRANVADRECPEAFPFPFWLKRVESAVSTDEGDGAVKSGNIR
jgi:hypothetical protein